MATSTPSLLAGHLRDRAGSTPLLINHEKSNRCLPITKMLDIDATKHSLFDVIADKHYERFEFGPDNPSYAGPREPIRAEWPRISLGPL